VLKQPLQTSVTIDNLDFEYFTVEEQLHIGISVKDFKAIVTHAETLKTSIIALYSFPTRPMQLSYREHGLQCDFTLMTIGDYRGGSVTPASAALRPETTAPGEKPAPRQSPAQASAVTRVPMMPPPSQPASRSFTKEPQSQRTQRPSPPPPRASLATESLFVPMEEDEDRVWGERNYDDDQDRLGWDASADKVIPL
jgi:cell cycle checkpoint control protein RAD9A